MKLPRRFGLLTQLLAGFAAGGLFVAMLLGIGDYMLRATSQRLVTTIEEHVRPLASLHRLQSRVAALRNMELELASLRDVFVVQTHSARLAAEAQALDEELRNFASHLEARSPDEARRLLGHWREYRARLADQLRLAGEMDMAAMGRITVSGSYLPFAAIQGLLSEAAGETERAAETAYQATVAEQVGQRRGLLLLVMLGSVVLAAGLAWSGRVVVRRVRLLHEHAQKLAAGEVGGAIEISGHDEIGDLAVAFDGMRNQVLTREAALRAAQAELEQRVAARTFDLQQANRRLVLFSQVVEQNPVGILIADAKGTVEFANQAYGQITGQDPAAVRGQSLASAMRAGEAATVTEVIRQASTQSRVWESEIHNCRPDGTSYWERVRLAPVHDADGTVAHLLLSREDISERHAQQERIAYQAHYDMLTGLPNRALAHDRLIQVTGRCRRDGGKAGAMFIDLDNFKQINDTLGHAAGDALLRQAAVRLRSAVRAEDTVARLGGDEFLIVIGGLTRGDETVEIAEKIIAAFASPFKVDDRELVSTPSIGIAVYPEDGADPMVLLRNADLAMYEAKEAGRNTYRFFNQSIHDISLRRLEIGRCLRGALERDELHVVYHPLVDAATGRVVGAEALMRWRSIELGEVAPDIFIPVAEQNGAILDLGRWVLREACATLASWAEVQPGFVMAVNVSPRQFRAPDFVEVVRQSLEEFALHPAQLEIEITEGVLLRNQAEVTERLAELNRLGVLMSMDDFGTGYSSLSYLRQFPFQTIKIDRSFIRDLSDDESDRALIVAAIRMAQAMGLHIVAEGVETDEQWRFLAEQGCDTLQGYRFGMPLRDRSFAKDWLNARVAPPAAAPSPAASVRDGAKNLPA